MCHQAKTTSFGEWVTDRELVANESLKVRSVDDTPCAKCASRFKRRRRHWSKSLNEIKPMAWTDKIYELLEDGTPRTFHRICVEAIGSVASREIGTSFFEGLWLLVDWDRVEHTKVAPIYFRKKE